VIDGYSFIIISDHPITITEAALVWFQSTVTFVYSKVDYTKHVITMITL